MIISNRFSTVLNIINRNSKRIPNASAFKAFSNDNLQPANQIISAENNFNIRNKNKNLSQYPSLASEKIKNSNLIINKFPIKNFTTKMDSRGKNYFEIKRQNKDIIITPKEGYDTALVFMHGLGDSADGYLDFFVEDYRPIPNRMKVVLLTAPSAPVTINGGAVMNSWYDILSFKREKGSISEEDVIRNSERIKLAISAEANALNGNYGKVFVGGFSQGCCMALYAALSFKENVGGVVGLSGLLFPFLELNKEEKKNIPIFLSHGKWDGVIPYQIAEESYQRLKDAKFNMKFHAFDDEHTIDYSTMDEVKNFLTKLV